MNFLWLAGKCRLWLSLWLQFGSILTSYSFSASQNTSILRRRFFKSLNLLFTIFQAHFNYFCMTGEKMATRRVNSDFIFVFSELKYTDSTRGIFKKLEKTILLEKRWYLFFFDKSDFFLSDLQSKKWKKRVQRSPRCVFKGEFSFYAIQIFKKSYL